MAKHKNSSDTPGCAFILFVSWWYVPIVGAFSLIKALVKLIKKAIQENREAEELVKAMAATPAPAPVYDSSPAIQSMSKSYLAFVSLKLVPPSIDGMTQAYCYIFSLSDISHEAITAAFESENYMLDIEQSEGVSYALINGERVGAFVDKYDMIFDWLKRGDPIRLFLREYEAGKACQVKLVFYKDLAAPHKHKEQSVVPLISYKSRDMQDYSCCVYEKMQVKIGEEDYGNGVLCQSDPNIVSCDGYVIGKVPAKIVKRIDVNGYSYAEIEEILEEENDNGDVIYHPIIRIYW